MFILDVIAEERIARARDAGEFDHLPGAGRPLELDDDRLVPEELRAAYRILRNAGFVPPEVEALKEAASLESLIRCLEPGDARARAVARLNLLAARLAQQRPGARLLPCYLDRVLDRLDRS
jgi:hypothetical protein